MPACHLCRQADGVMVFSKRDGEETCYAHRECMAWSDAVKGCRTPDDDSVQCAFLRKNGMQCRRKAVGNGACWLHSRDAWVLSSMPTSVGVQCDLVADLPPAIAPRDKATATTDASTQCDDPHEAEIERLQAMVSNLRASRDLLQFEVSFKMDQARRDGLLQAKRILIDSLQFFA